MAAQENHVNVVKYLLDKTANPTLATEVLPPAYTDCLIKLTGKSTKLECSEFSTCNKIAKLR